MKKQTAVQWLLEQMPELEGTSTLETALILEKLQISIAYSSGLLQFYRKPEDIKITEYYDNTYGEGEGIN